MAAVAHFDAPATPRVAFIRTSDRSTFRRCRRKWNWSYVHRGNRTQREQANPLWLGSGFHFALEDYHGVRQFGDHGRDALLAYTNAWLACKDLRPPADWKELLELGSGMLDYYELWLQNGRDPLKTFVWNGRYQCEVRFEIEIPLPHDVLERAGYDKAIYQGTLDRVSEDEYGRLWIVEYKTAKAFQQGHFDTDGQITAYCWAASVLYDRPIAGVVYQQHKKNIPKPPAFLKTTKMFSIAKGQTTTRALYRQALIECFGSIKAAPQPNQQFLGYLAEGENENRDDLVLRSFVNRNDAQVRSEGLKILMEAEEMIDPNLRIYPNPTRDCSWDCTAFHTACVNLDDGSDWQYEIETNTVDREEERDSWRIHLQTQQSVLMGQEQEQTHLDQLEAELLGSPLAPPQFQQQLLLGKMTPL